MQQVWLRAEQQRGRLEKCPHSGEVCPNGALAKPIEPLPGLQTGFKGGGRSGVAVCAREAKVQAQAHSATHAEIL